MKQLTIVVRPFRAEAVLKAISQLDVNACMVLEAKGFSRQKGYLERYQGSEYSMAFLPKVEISVWVSDQRLQEVEEKITILNAFKRADDVLLQAVQGITDLIMTPGIINLDFADVMTVMRGKGVALMGIGTGDGEDAASKAMRAALDYKLLEENSIKGAKAALINVTGGPQMILGEIEDAIGMIEAEADDNADIIWGSVIKDDIGDEIRITVIATGFDSQYSASIPQPRMAEAHAVSASRIPFAAPDIQANENFEEPTFRRRQAD